MMTTSKTPKKKPHKGKAIKRKHITVRNSVDYYYGATDDNPVYKAELYSRIWKRIKDNPFMSNENLRVILCKEFGLPGIATPRRAITNERIENIRKKILLHQEILAILEADGKIKRNTAFWARYFVFTKIFFRIAEIDKALSEADGVTARAGLYKAHASVCERVSKFVAGHKHDKRGQTKQTPEETLENLKRQLETEMGDDEDE